MLMIIILFFFVGVFYSSTELREIAQASNTTEEYEVWTEGSPSLVVGDQLYVESLLKKTDKPFLAFSNDGMELSYLGRLPRYESIDVAVVDGEIKVRAFVYNQSSMQECEYQHNKLENTFLIEVEERIQLEDSALIQEPAISFETIPILEPRVLLEARQCFESIEAGLEEVSNQEMTIQILAQSLISNPQSLSVRGADEGLMEYITFFKACPCDEYPTISADASLWLQRYAEEVDPSQYITFTGRFTILPSKSLPRYSSADITEDTIEDILASTRGLYNAHIVEFVEVDGKSLDQVIGDYSRKQDRLRQAQLEAQQQSLRSTTAPSNSVTSSPGSSGSVAQGCFGSDASLSQLYCLMNEYRVQNGSGVLIANGPMTQAAFNHNNWMSATGNFSHSGEGGSRFWNRCEAVGAVCSSEILARASYTSASQCMIAWKLSPQHNAALLNPTFTQVGGAIGGGFCTAVLR
jgi:uncharacterized protein YkwD